MTEAVAAALCSRKPETRAPAQTLLSVFQALSSKPVSWRSWTPRLAPMMKVLHRALKLHCTSSHFFYHHEQNLWMERSLYWFVSIAQATVQGDGSEG